MMVSKTNRLRIAGMALAALAAPLCAHSAGFYAEAGAGSSSVGGLDKDALDELMTQVGEDVFDTFTLNDPSSRGTSYRETLSLVETELSRQLAEGTPLERPQAGRVSRRVKHFPLTPQVQVFTSDLETKSSVIQALHSAGRLVLCYFSAGSMEPFRSDAAAFPANALGASLSDYPEERWVDVRDATVRSLMQARLAKAANAGCDGVHPSGLGAFLANTELGFTRADQLAYNHWLAGAAHGLGLSIGLVEGDASLSQAEVADFDWIVVWSCVDSGCPAAAPFVAAGKAAFLIEYGDETRAAAVCAPAKALGLSAIIKKDSDLDAFRVGCL
jgi:hypothetical protein